MVAVYDTLARAVVPIEPADGRALTMYSCGPTVYRYAHIGNLRTFLMADLIRRAFEYQGIEVRQIQNITDVGHMTDELTDSGRDRMELAVEDEQRSAQEIADFYTQAFLDDTAAFNIRRAAAISLRSISIFSPLWFRTVTEASSTCSATPTTSE